MSKGNSLNTEEARQLRGLAEQLNWTSSQTRPDMSLGACKLNASVADAKISNLAKVNKYVRKLKLQKVLLQFPNLGNIQQCSILCFSDATFANLRNALSQGPFIIFLIKNSKYMLQYPGGQGKFSML